MREREICPKKERKNIAFQAGKVYYLRKRGFFILNYSEKSAEFHKHAKKETTI